MKLKSNEFTTNSLLDYLKNKYGKKISNKEFNHSDIAQYCLRGYLPYRYGGNVLTVKRDFGVKIITLEEKK